MGLSKAAGTMVCRLRLLLLALCLSAAPLPARASARGGGEQPRYDTVYACEGKVLAIRCTDGNLIHLIRANYGRFSITICNEHGNTEWSVNCMSPKSLRVLHNRCSQQQNCSIVAATSMFGDPCPGTLKYLEAHYQCMPATTTTDRPSPPWLTTSQPSVWSTLRVEAPLPPPPQPMPETEQECAEVFQQRIRAAHGRQLLPLVEDLADWINKTLGLDCLTGDNFFDVLDNGALLCRLARLIHERAQALADQGDLSSTQVPVIRGRCWDNAARRSFFSRDNMENFIQFCRRLGVHENLIFESDDLVLHNQPRSVVLCLLEVSRLAARLGVEPAGLVQLEREIAEEEQRERDDSLLSWQFRASPALTPRASPDKMRHSSSSSAISMSAGGSRWGKGRPRSGDRRSLMLDSSASPPHDARRTVSEGHAASDGVPSDATEVDDDWSRGSADADGDADHDDADGELELDGDSSRTEDVTELDRKVQQATRLAQRQCHCPSGRCPKLKVRKVGEGKYNIAGRNVFVRLLKGRHMMVRVGGGWDTLDHFLLRHDPCQVKVVSRDSPYLHITAKYRSNSHASR